jgi:hypothetical protein
MKTNSKTESLFERLSKINVSDKTEKKGKFTYLSWAYALQVLKKEVPNAVIKVYEDPNTHLPYFASNAGVLIKVSVTINEEETVCYLPVMDFRNQAIQADKVNMMDVNKTIQRCTVKAIAMATGIGLYIYAGEDLPEGEEKQTPRQTVDLATEGQRKALFAIMGKEEYTKHKSFIETKMTKKQASEKIEALKAEGK